LDYLGSLLKITEIDHILELYFVHGYGFAITLTKNGLGNILGDFFTNSTGYPVCEYIRVKGVSLKWVQGSML
jgi:hypothetical protein